MRGAQGIPPLLLAMLACAGPAPVPQAPCEDRVWLHQIEEPDSVRLEVENGCPVVVAVEVWLDRAENLRSTVEFPVRADVSPGETYAAGTLHPIDTTRPWSYEVGFSWRVGRREARHDERVRYRLPFGGALARELVQGVDGEVSHQARQRHAFDWAMPVGTPVLAAREGTVIRVVDLDGEGAPDARARLSGNLVTVAHPDGTFADYAHLSPGVSVRPGERVSPGTLLAYSGNSGFSSAPHLHFHVWSVSEGREPETIPIRFGREGSVGFVPEVGQAYGPGPDGFAAAAR